MKQYINSKSIPILVLLSTFVAVLLRIWTRGAGPDDNGLFASKPLPWLLLWLLTAATVAAIVFAVRDLKRPGSYRDNYPKSWISALCAVPAAVIFLVNGYTQIRDALVLALPNTTAVDTVTGVFGLIAGVCLLLSAVHRFLGKKPFFLINGLVCLYLAVRLFQCCQLWNKEPQLGIVVFPFLASNALMLSAYHRVCFDVDMGKRFWSALWTLLSVYLCVVAMLSFEQPLFYALCALWKITDLCSLRPLKQRKPQAEPGVTDDLLPPQEEV